MIKLKTFNDNKNYTGRSNYGNTVKWFTWLIFAYYMKHWIAAK